MCWIKNFWGKPHLPVHVRYPGIICGQQMMLREVYNVETATETALKPQRCTNSTYAYTCIYIYLFVLAVYCNVCDTLSTSGHAITKIHSEIYGIAGLVCHSALDVKIFCNLASFLYNIVFLLAIITFILHHHHHTSPCAYIVFHYGKTYFFLRYLAKLLLTTQIPKGQRSGGKAGVRGNSVTKVIIYTHKNTA